MIIINITLLLVQAHPRHHHHHPRHCLVCQPHWKLVDNVTDHVVASIVLGDAVLKLPLEQDLTVLVDHLALAVRVPLLEHALVPPSRLEVEHAVPVIIIIVIVIINIFIIIIVIFIIIVGQG